MRHALLAPLICWLAACHVRPAGRNHPQPLLVVKVVRVSPDELVVAGERGDAGATITIEHPPIRAPNPNAGYLPDVDLGPAYVFLLLDRRRQLVSMGGVSPRHTAEWQDLARAEPTRTADELDADLQVAADMVVSLQGQPRGTEAYVRELSDMLRTAVDLKGIRAPTESVRCDQMDPPTCDPR